MNLIGIYFYAEKALYKSSLNNYIKPFHIIRLHWWTVYTISVFKTFSMVVNPSVFESVSDCHFKNPHVKGEGKEKGHGEGKIINCQDSVRNALGRWQTFLQLVV